MRIGVCSWSLQPASPAELAARAGEVWVRHVQLALDPLRRGDWSVDDLRSSFEASGLSVLSGMMEMKDEDYSTLETIRETGGVRPDAHLEHNIAAAHGNAELAARLGLDLVTLHAGFLPHDADDPERAAMLDRLRQLADAFAAHGVRMGLETGQEDATTLLGAFRDLAHENVGINFDPANMILYGMGDPVTSLRELAPHVVQIHVKDATPTEVPGTWGAEVPVGTGAVDWDAFFGVMKEHDLGCDLVIEREAGDQRVADARTALALVQEKAPA